MEAETLKIKWKCSCKEPHKCTVIGGGEIVTLIKFSAFAGANNTFCFDADEAGDDTYFIKFGNGPQQAVEYDDLNALLLKNNRS